MAHLPATGFQVRELGEDAESALTIFLYLRENLEPSGSVQFASFQEENWPQQFMTLFFLLLLAHEIAFLASQTQKMQTLTHHITVNSLGFWDLFQSLICSLDKHLLSICCVPVFVLRAKHTEKSKTEESP